MCHNLKNGKHTQISGIDLVSGLCNGYECELAFTTFSIGELSFLKVLTTPIVVLNSVRVANELLAKRGAVYSGRPLTPMSVL